MNERMDCDLLVVGSGASGLAAAVTAAWHGLRVVVVEKAPVIGGASAWSGGWMWVPGNPLAKRAGYAHDPAQARTFLKNVLRERHDPERVNAFLDNAGKMVEFFEQHTALQFVDGNGIPDIHTHLEGSSEAGRQVIAAPYDARNLGALHKRLRPTLRETSFMGMPIMAGPDLAAFLNMTRSFKAFFHVTRRFTRHLRDLAFHGRAMHLVNGVALIGRLAKSADDLGVRMIESASAQRLLLDNGVVRGAVVRTAKGDVEIHATRGVVLAAGGFPNDVERRKALFPRTPTGHEHLALPPSSCSGDGIALGESAGGVQATDLASPVAWAPVSRVPHADGSVGHFPHIIDRAKPGLIAVLSNGQRFVNEATGYHDFVAAMVAQAPQGTEVCAWIVCDHRFLRRYGLGYVRPFPVPFGRFLRSGYLRTGKTIEALARACGLPEDALHTTVERFNLHAHGGKDPDFGRGTTPYNRRMGDALHEGPNPCVAPIAQGPFYAVKVLPGSFGTFAGLKTNGHAQVSDAEGSPITGLYAVGTDMASALGGHYPSGGINLGPAMTFGFIAGRHAAGA
ncbi:FAD-dependent oxidoreductase [Hydrogenophaga palleronii]|uniref:FAD-dependent oxidoreductase n=1 Tax=Hydrogenophaga palleronii TaxID=65655 RepID=UPI000824A0A7|nr:FAD-dependent oxidoreductase [Hydrogenophaga palleronii]